MAAEVSERSVDPDKAFRLPENAPDNAATIDDMRLIAIRANVDIWIGGHVVAKPRRLGDIAKRHRWNTHRTNVAGSVVPSAFFNVKYGWIEWLVFIRNQQLKAAIL